MVKKYWWILLVILLLFAAPFIWAAYQVISPIQADNENDIEVHIAKGLEYQDVLTLLEENGLIKNKMLFDALAERMNYIKSPMRSGRYVIPTQSNTLDLIRHLRNGKQDPVKLTFSSAWDTNILAGKMAQPLSVDSTSILSVFQDAQLLDSLGFNNDNLMSLFIPNTYFVYWDIDAKELLIRMKKEYDSFWSQNERLKKLEMIGLNENQVYTVASIIERETNQNSEKQRMAGVYLNRVNKGMKLQADPTVKFAMGDYKLSRILLSHLKFKSPYNTYHVEGLPPGPISLASIPSIDAVLNREDHNYIFFCKRPDDTGLHAFATSLSGHNQNARKYYRWARAKRRAANSG